MADEEEDETPQTIDEMLANMCANLDAQQWIQTGLFHLAMTMEFRHWQWVGSHHPKAKEMPQSKLDRIAAMAAFDSFVNHFPEEIRGQLMSKRDHYVDHLVATSDRASQLEIN